MTGSQKADASSRSTSAATFAASRGRPTTSAIPAWRSNASAASQPARQGAGRRTAPAATAATRTPRNALPGGGFSYIEGFNKGTGVTTQASAVDVLKTESQGTFIVLFSEDSLSTYQGGTAGLMMPPRNLSGKNGSRINSQSLEAKHYVSYLQGRQQLMEEQMAGVAGRPLDVRQRMQHAVNGIIVDMSQAEAAAIAKMPGVRLVEGYREYPLETDTGPTLIGAPAVWSGADPFGAPASKGEGVVAGLIDSGINFGSPSFAAIDPVTAYAHANPLGNGVYLGTCLAGGADENRCNNKLIGGHDFVCAAPGNQCGQPNIREEPGFGDTNGHGSHTASTVVGNTRDVSFSGTPLRISGVAPRANIIAYDVCYTNTSTNQGLCPNVSTVAAVNQAVADGVDVINYSIGGGTEPWLDATSLAFLSAVDAGVFVAVSAGNSGPLAGTLSHLEPWVSSTAAAQHGRGSFSFLLQVTGPTPVPPALQPVVMTPGSNGVSLAATIPGTTPLLVSAGIDTTSDACSALPANSFANAIAVVRRGTCSFAIKANNATAAGAIAVVIANNQAGSLLPSVPGTTVPVFGVSQANGNLLRDFAVLNPTTMTAQIGYPPIGLPNTADALAAFSSRGPAGRFDLIKPDVTAPGVDVMAATAGTTITGFEQLVGLNSGTSMASPHNAGSAALIRQARPSWTPMEIKSALMMTATPTVFTEDQVSLANPFARGSGRLRVDRAIKAGLVLNETAANFSAANPDAGGNPGSLNIASFAEGNCAPTCQFTRTFRNAGTSGSLWSLSVSGLSGTVSSPLMWVPVGASRTVTVTLDSTGLPTNGSWNFGSLQLTKLLSGGMSDSSAALALPLAIAVPPPTVSVPDSVSASVAEGSNGVANFAVGNIGGAVLNYTASTSGSGVATHYRANREAITSGVRNTSYTDPAAAGANAQYAADDFQLSEPSQLTSLVIEGFVVSNAAFNTVVSQVTWSIYPDAAGLPAGHPSQSPNSAAVWTYTAVPTAPGVSTAGGFITLNLATAGQNVNLAPGTYWLVVNTRSTFANRWAQYGSNTGNGSLASITVASDGSGSWGSSNSFAGLNMRVFGNVNCGAPWLGTITPASGSIFGGGSVPTSAALNSMALSPAVYRANVCVNSNDLATPVAAVPVQLTVNPPPP